MKMRKENILWNVLLGAAMGLAISRLLLPRTTTAAATATTNKAAWSQACARTGSFRATRRLTSSSAMFAPANAARMTINTRGPIARMRRLLKASNDRVGGNTHRAQSFPKSRRGTCASFKDLPVQRRSLKKLHAAAVTGFSHMPQW